MLVPWNEISTRVFFFVAHVRLWCDVMIWVAFWDAEIQPDEFWSCNVLGPGAGLCPTTVYLQAEIKHKKSCWNFFCISSWNMLLLLQWKTQKKTKKPWKSPTIYKMISGLGENSLNLHGLQLDLSVISICCLLEMRFSVLPKGNAHVFP